MKRLSGRRVLPCMAVLSLAANAAASPPPVQAAAVPSLTRFGEPLAISVTSCTASRLGTSIPAAAIGEPVSGVTLGEPKWVPETARCRRAVRSTG